MDFEFLKNPINKKWVISAPRRAKRPNVAKGVVSVCPFCVGKENPQEEVYRIPSQTREQAKQLFGVESDWMVRVITNKFPFAPIHELVIHSPNHGKNFEQLSLHQVELILKTYRQRYLAHQGKGHIYIFHNRGKGGGESLNHPHTQIVVVPEIVDMEIPLLDPQAYVGYSPHPTSVNSLVEKVEIVNKTYSHLDKEEMVETKHFYLFCPQTSQWPDEVWMAPKKRGELFGEISDGQIADFAYVLTRLIQIFDLRHSGNEFSFNFYIYPGKDWYLRLIPRDKTIGGFELCTGIFVNTQDPKETLMFLKTHFNQPDEEKIRTEYQADYRRGV